MFASLWPLRTEPMIACFYHTDDIFLIFNEINVALIYPEEREHSSAHVVLGLCVFILFSRLSELQIDFLMNSKHMLLKSMHKNM